MRTHLGFSIVMAVIAVAGSVIITPSFGEPYPTVHCSQPGYRPADKKWIAVTVPAGSFQTRHAELHSAVFSGALTLRCEFDSAGGDQVYEGLFTSFDETGGYYALVPEVSAAHPFTIGEGPMPISAECYLSGFTTSVAAHRSLRSREVYGRTPPSTTTVEVLRLMTGRPRAERREDTLIPWAVGTIRATTGSTLPITLTLLASCLRPTSSATAGIFREDLWPPASISPVSGPGVPRYRARLSWPGDM